MNNYILNINNINDDTILDYENSEDTNIRLAKDAEVLAVNFFSCNFIIKKKGKRIHINFSINCNYIQQCGVTLDEVSQTISSNATRNYIVSIKKKVSSGVDISLDSADDIEYLTEDNIDLYGIVLEELILNIDYNFKKSGVDITEYSKDLMLGDNIKFHIDKIKS